MSFSSFKGRVLIFLGLRFFLVIEFLLRGDFSPLSLNLEFFSNYSINTFYGWTDSAGSVNSGGSTGSYVISFSGDEGIGLF